MDDFAAPECKSAGGIIEKWKSNTMKISVKSQRVRGVRQSCRNNKYLGKAKGILVQSGKKITRYSGFYWEPSPSCIGK
jgi:hypothetical protein